jgi:hypothetical protein
MPVLFALDASDSVALLTERLAVVDALWCDKRVAFDFGAVCLVSGGKLMGLRSVRSEEGFGKVFHRPVWGYGASVAAGWKAAPRIQGASDKGGEAAVAVEAAAP